MRVAERSDAFDLVERAAKVNAGRMVGMQGVEQPAVSGGRATSDESTVERSGQQGWLGRRPPGALALVARAVITLYQHTVGPLIPSSCRFRPSCSRYAYEALGTHGFFKGGWLGLKRLGRCHPLTKAGFDPVPERKA